MIPLCFSQIYLNSVTTVQEFVKDGQNQECQIICKIISHTLNSIGKCVHFFVNVIK